MEANAYSAYSVYLALAKHLYKRKQYDKALAYYRFAEDVGKTKKRVNDVLFDRAMVNFQEANIEEARDDVDASLVLDPTSIQNKYANAYILYQQNKFEDSLLESYRGYRQRKQPNYFGQGVQYAMGTIEDCVGYNGGPFTDLDVLGKTIIEMKLRELNMSPPDKKMSPVALKKREIAVVNKKKYMSEKFLAAVSKDKRFLTELTESPSLLFGNKANIAKIKKILDVSFKKLGIKEEALWKRRPMYSISYQTGRPPPKLASENKKLQEQRKMVIDEEILRQLCMMYNAMGKMEWVKCYKTGQSVRTLVLSLPHGFIPQAPFYLKAADFILGQSILSTKVLLPCWDQETNDKRLLFMMGITSAYESVVELFRDSFHTHIADPKKFIAKTLEGLSLTEEDLEVAFLCHEMACCYSLQNKLKYSRSYARKCILASKRAGDFIWYVNGVFMLARVELQSANLFDALVALTTARDAAAKFGLTSAEMFAMRALKLLDGKRKEDLEGVSGNEKAERSLMGLMENMELKCQAAKAFQMIKSKPPHMRMSFALGVSRKGGAAKPHATMSKDEAEKEKRVLTQAIHRFIERRSTLRIDSQLEFIK